MGDLEDTRVVQATEIRKQYDSALGSTYKIFCDSEEIAAFLVLDLRRLQRSNEEADKDKIEEKEKLLVQVKDNMYFVLDQLASLAKQKNEYLSDIYTSSKIVDIETDLSDLTPWLSDLSRDVESQASQAKSAARITTEISHAMRA